MADTDEERRRGLMGRSELGEDEGPQIVFSGEQMTQGDVSAKVAAATIAAGATATPTFTPTTDRGFEQAQG